MESPAHGNSESPQSWLSPTSRRHGSYSRPTSGSGATLKGAATTLVVLVDESGFILALSNFDKAAKVEYPGTFHVGFMQQSREQVDEIYHRLKSDGLDVKTPKEFHGAWTFFFHAPGGFLVEVGYQHM